MKKIFAGLASLTLLTGSAFAADLARAPAYKAPPPPAAPTVSWTGCYIDGGGGYGLWNQDHHTNTPAGSTVTTTDGGRGWVGRFGGGCDYQTSLFNNRIVIGAFADWDPMDLRGSNSPSLLFGTPSQPVTANEKETSAWFVGARVGYLVNPDFLTYFDGGFTQTRFTQSGEFLTLTATPIGFSLPNFNDHGWFLGSGFEYALDGWIPFHGLFLQTEYRFSHYATRNLSEFAIATGVPDGNVEVTKPYVQTITSALVWRFNWTGH